MDNLIPAIAGISGGRTSALMAYGLAPDVVLSFQMSMEPRRVRLIIAQELATSTPFSCECDAAKGDEFDAQMEMSL